MREGREIGVRPPRPDFSWRRLVGRRELSSSVPRVSYREVTKRARSAQCRARRLETHRPRRVANEASAFLHRTHPTAMISPARRKGSSGLQPLSLLRARIVGHEISDAPLHRGHAQRMTDSIAFRHNVVSHLARRRPPLGTQRNHDGMEIGQRLVA